MSTMLPLEENPLRERSTHVPFGNWIAGPFTDLGLRKIVKLVVPTREGGGNVEGIACSSEDITPELLIVVNQRTLFVGSGFVSTMRCFVVDLLKLTSFPATKKVARTGFETPPSIEKYLLASTSAAVSVG